MRLINWVVDPTLNICASSSSPGGLTIYKWPSWPNFMYGGIIGSRSYIAGGGNIRSPDSWNFWNRSIWRSISKLVIWSFKPRLSPARGGLDPPGGGLEGLEPCLKRLDPRLSPARGGLGWVSGPVLGPGLIWDGFYANLFLSETLPLEANRYPLGGARPKRGSRWIMRKRRS